MSHENSYKKQSFRSRSASTMQSIKTRIAIAMLAVFALAACGNQAIETVIVSTLAGGKQGFADGQGSAARFNGANGIAIDAAGNLYVADTGNNRIRKITPKGEVNTLAGRFDVPFGIAIDAAGTFYVTDRSKNPLRKITPNGVISPFASEQGNPTIRDILDRSCRIDLCKSSTRFNELRDITIDALGNLYVTDVGNMHIHKVTQQEDVSTLAGGGGAYQEGFVDGKGSTARFGYPLGITIDAAGNLYVVDRGNHSIRKVTLNGEVSTLAGDGKEGFADGEGSAARFWYPAGIAVDAMGNLYVADSSNNRIRKVTPKGEVSTLAGGERGFADGKGSAARFDHPYGIAIDTVGNLYVTDQNNDSIRKIVIKRP